MLDSWREMKRFVVAKPASPRRERGTRIERIFQPLTPVTGNQLAASIRFIRPVHYFVLNNPFAGASVGGWIEEHDERDLACGTVPRSTELFNSFVPSILSLASSEMLICHAALALAPCCRHSTAWRDIYLTLRWCCILRNIQSKCARVVRPLFGRGFLLFGRKCRYFAVQSMDVVM